MENKIILIQARNCSYRLKHVMKDEMSSMCTNKKYNTIHMKIVGAINIHRKAIE